MALTRLIPTLATIMTVCGLLIAAATAAQTNAAIPLPREGAVIVFFGDSITQAGSYVDYVDAFFATRHPARRYSVLNRGVTSETISGTSEPDHVPRRPCALDRFTRDIVSARPDVLVACFGMNDGNYLPFDEERFKRYQQGVHTLIERARSESHATLILLTPPPYDPYARKVLDPDALSFGYKFPAIDYDETLERYSAWMLTLRESGVHVVDVHAAMKAHLRERRTGRVSFSLQEDGIHPNATGHWVMAAALLEAWGAKDLGDQARVDVVEKTSTKNATGLVVGDGAIAFTWRMMLPMPRAPDWDGESVAIQQRCRRFEQHRLVVEGLAEGNYHLRADERVTGTVSEMQWREGLDLLKLDAFPTTRLSQKVLEKVHRRQRLEVSLWRKQVVNTAPADDSNARRPEAELRDELGVLDREIRELCRPREIQIALERVE